MNVSYVEFGVKNSRKFLRKLVFSCNFRPIAFRSTNRVQQFVCQSKDATLLITEKSGRNGIIGCQDLVCKDSCVFTHSFVSSATNETEEPFTVDWHFPEGRKEPSESVFNVAFFVRNVDNCIRKVSESGGTIVKPVTVVKDKDGCVKVAVIKSKAGNVLHTLIEKNNYDGAFLPSFQSFHSSLHCHCIPFVNDSCVQQNPKEFNNNEKHNEIITHFDHVTIVCHSGTMEEIQKWYEKCFGLKRFRINRNDTEEDGLQITGPQIGLKLKALEYWKCAETGLFDPSQLNSVKIVLAESLSDQGPNQVDTFLKEHGGPGIQHVALHTNDICSVVASWKRDGMEFVDPPSTYYSEVDVIPALTTTGNTWDLLEENGILVDTEQDLEGSKQCNEKTRYLLQKFTKPLFEKDTFFFEIIQREGAVGFGSGNIKALWRAVRSYLDDKAGTHS